MFWTKFGTLLVAAALLYAAAKVHKSRGKGAKVAKPAGIILAFLAGCAFLVTVVGPWMLSLAEKIVGFSVAGLIVCVAIIIVDWLLDKKPDKPAFWAALLLPLFLVLGFSQLPSVAGQIGDGAKQVGGQIQQIDKPNPAQGR